MKTKENEGAMRRKLLARGIRSITDNRDAKVMCVAFEFGDKRIVRCSPQDDYDPEIGFALAIVRYMWGSRTQVLKFLDEYARTILAAERPDEPTDNPSLERPVEFDPHWFRDWMEERKLSSADVAGRCGVSVDTVSRARLGYRVSAGTFNKLCFGLGLNKEERGSLLRCLTKRRPRYRK